MKKKGLYETPGNGGGKFIHTNIEKRGSITRHYKGTLEKIYIESQRSQTISRKDVTFFFISFYYLYFLLFLRLVFFHQVLYSLGFHSYFYFHSHSCIVKFAKTPYTHLIQAYLVDQRV